MTSILLALLAGAGVNIGAITTATVLGVPALKAAKVLSYGPSVCKILKKIPKPEHIPEKSWFDETQEERHWRQINDNW